MRLALLTSTFLPKLGGAQVFTHNIAAHLATRGHSVDVYVPRSTPGAENAYGYTVRFLPPRFYGLATRLPLFGRCAAAAYLRGLQRFRNYDAWLVVMSYPSGYVATGLRGRVPILLRCSGEDIQKSADLGYGTRLDGRLENQIVATLGAYDRLVALTPSVRAEFLDLGVSPERIRIVPNGVNLERFGRGEDTARLREELGWPPRTTVLLTTGRYHRKKGFELIPDIARTLVEQGLDFRWYLVGRGARRIRPALEAARVAERVTCLEEVGMSSAAGGDDVPPRKLVHMYRAADIFAFPSLLETFGMVQIEAMAAGIPVVTTDAPGCRDVVQDGVNGLQAPAGDAEAFARQLIRLFRDPVLREELGAAGAESAKRYEWDRVAEEYERIFVDLSAEPRGDRAHHESVASPAPER